MIKIVYNMLKNDADRNDSYRGNNWAYQIKNTLNDLGLTYLWTTQEARDSFQIIQQRILDQYKQSWYTNINNSRRLLSYSRYKHDFESEKYLEVIYDKKFRSALSRFRLSSHQLMIEKGRYNNIPVDERICRFCNMNQLENEYHFLLICPLYHNLRKRYLKPYYCRWPTLNKFDTLMTSKNKQELLNLGKYLHFANKARDSRQTENDTR